MCPATIDWDAVYRAGTTWGQTVPSDFLWRCVDQLSDGASVLDLGCGTGRNAHFLSRLGYRVTGLDVSGVAIEQLRRTAQLEGLAIDTKVGNLLAVDFEENGYDLVLAYGLLNSLPRSQWNEAIRRAQSWAKPGGFNVLTYFNSYSSVSSVDGYEVVDLAEPEFGLAVYSDWTLIHHDSRCETHQHGSRPTHQHVTERLLTHKMPPEPNRNESEVVAVIGPSNLRKAELTGPLREGALVSAADAVGKLLATAGKQLLCVPDLGVGRQVLSAYTDNSPKHLPHILAPADNSHLAVSTRDKWIHALPGGVHIDEDVTWENQARVLVERSDEIITLGLSTGTAQEILWTRSIRRPVYFSLDVSSRLPAELRRDLALFELPDMAALLNYVSVRWL